MHDACDDFINPTIEKYPFRFTPLGLAIFEGRLEMVNLLIAAAKLDQPCMPDINGNWSNAFTPLLLAVICSLENKQGLDIIRSLIEAGTCAYQEIVIHLDGFHIRLSPMSYANKRKHRTVRQILKTQKEPHVCKHCAWRKIP